MINNGLLAAHGLKAEIDMQPSVALLLTIVFIIVASAAIVLLYFGVRRERHRFIADKLKLSVMNKTSFDEMIARRVKVAKKNSHFSVMLVKIADARELAVSLGDKQYEALLVDLQERLYTVLPKNSKACVYEDDVIAVFIDEDLDGKALSDLAGFAIVECTKTFTLVTKVDVKINVYIGAVAYDHSLGLSADKFTGNAEEALKTAERSGENKYSVYSPEMDYSEDETYQYYRGMKNAIETNEYVLRYAPVYTDENETAAFRSLLRWDHKEQGVIEGEKFLPALVQSGEIFKVGEKTFSQLCADINKYKQSAPNAETVFTFYATERQMSTSNFPDEIYRLSKKFRVEPQNICIEIDAFTDKIVTENIKKFKGFAFKIAAVVDTENAAGAMGQMQDVSPDWIEIPADFIATCKENYFYKGIAEMIVKFAAENNATVVATDLGTEEELATARELGINRYQGKFVAEEKESL